MLRDFYKEAKNKLMYVTKKSIEEENGTYAQSANDVVRNVQQRHEKFLRAKNCPDHYQVSFRECFLMV